MVIGGYNGRRNDYIEELKMNSSLEDGCPVTDRLPVTIDGAVGANMGGDNGSILLISFLLNQILFSFKVGLPSYVLENRWRTTTDRSSHGQAQTNMVQIQTNAGHTI